jgi:hypothetical protein
MPQEITFTVCDVGEGDADALAAAGSAMVRHMQDELWGYLGISASAEDLPAESIFGLHGRVTHGHLPGSKLVHYQQHDSQALQATLGRFEEGYRQANPAVSAVDMGRARAMFQGQVGVARDRFLGLFASGIDVCLSTKDPNSIGSPLLSYQYAPPGHRMAPHGGYFVNPFTWFARTSAGAVVVATLDGTARGRAANGPTMHLLHESDHDLGLMSGGPPTGDEIAVTDDVDMRMVGHPDVAQRGWYPLAGNSASLPGALYVLGAGSPRSTSATHPDWVRWPSDQTLRTGTQVLARRALPVTVAQQVLALGHAVGNRGVARLAASDSLARAPLPLAGNVSRNSPAPTGAAAHAYRGRVESR